MSTERQYKGRYVQRMWMFSSRYIVGAAYVCIIECSLFCGHRYGYAIVAIERAQTKDGGAVHNNVIKEIIIIICAY